MYVVQVVGKYLDNNQKLYDPYVGQDLDYVQEINFARRIRTRDEARELARNVRKSNNYIEPRTRVLKISNKVSLV